MAEFNILETLELVGKAKTREEKRQILTDRDNFATRALLQLNYHPDVKWYLPSGAPPYTPCLLYTSPSPRDRQNSRMPSSA